MWWELRRGFYNLTLAPAGFISVLAVVAVLSSFAGPGEDGVEPAIMWSAVILYALAANGAYTLGWVTELLWSGGNPSKTKAFRGRAFKAGLVFSIALTLTPAMIFGLVWLAWRPR